MKNATAFLPYRGETQAERGKESKVRSIGKSRVQLDLSPRAMSLLTELKEKTDASSYAEVIKNALKLYDGLITEVENGSDFLIRDKDGHVGPYKMFL